jgi:aryl-alcohol dehydrogenase-like predicted oxidoreductase
MGCRRIGSTRVELTELGFGASAIGNLYGVTPAHDAQATVEAAWEAGVRYFDTAPHHGLGLSERRLGAALRDRPSGLLSREWPAEGMKYHYQEASPALVARARAIAEVCAAHGTTLPAAAVAFPLSHPHVINVTLGTRTAVQVGRNVELHRQHIPEAPWDDLRARELIRSDVPPANGPVRSARCL